MGIFDVDNSTLGNSTIFYVVIHLKLPHWNKPRSIVAINRYNCHNDIYFIVIYYMITGVHGNK